jgi:glycosyltransferase involved in cell wall biosynthesis
LTPRVSVLLPVHDGASYLEQAVRSILEQSLSDLELIVIDDGSTDGSRDISRRLEEADGRVRVVARPQTGITGALTDGLALARAELVARMDADDLALPERLEKQVAYLEAHSACVAVGTAFLVIDPRGDPIKVPDTPIAHDAIDARLLRGDGWALAHPTVMMRRATLRAVGGYRSAFDKVEDLDLFLRMAERGRLANLPEVLLHLRQHFASSTAVSGDSLDHVRLRVVREAYERRGRTAPPRIALVPHVRLDGCAQHLSWTLSAVRGRRLRQAARHARDALRAAPRRPRALAGMVRALAGATFARWLTARAQR